MLYHKFMLDNLHYFLLGIVLVIHFTDTNKTYHTAKILDINDCPNRRCTATIVVEGQKTNFNFRKLRRELFDPIQGENIYVSKDNEYNLKRIYMLTFFIKKYFAFTFIVVLLYFIYKLKNN